MYLEVMNQVWKGEMGKVEIGRFPTTKEYTLWVQRTTGSHWAMLLYSWRQSKASEKGDSYKSELSVFLWGLLGILNLVEYQSDDMVSPTLREKYLTENMIHWKGSNDYKLSIIFPAC